jgi:hypothetical protein
MTRRVFFVLAACCAWSISLGTGGQSADVFVENIASVVAAIGADELDYQISVSGALSGSVTGIAFALAGADTRQVLLNTSTLGPQSGMVTVTTSSQGAANTLFNLPVNFTVGPGVEFLEADFNQDHYVDAADLAQWESDYGVNADSDADGDGDSDGKDFLIWQRQLGQSSLPLAAAQAVPEPAAALLILGAWPLLLAGWRPTREPYTA